MASPPLPWEFDGPGERREAGLAKVAYSQAHMGSIDTKVKRIAVV